MADPDRAALLDEAYKRGVLPPDMRGAYEEAQRRNLLPSEPSFGEEVLAGVTAPVRAGMEIAEQFAPKPAAAAAPGADEGVVREPKIRTGEVEPLSPGHMIGSAISGGPVIGGAMAGIGRLAPTMPRMLQAGVAGSLGGLTQPVGPGPDFAQRKAIQGGEGMVLGFGLSLGGKAVSAGVNKLGDFLVRKYPDSVMDNAVRLVLGRIEKGAKAGGPTAQQMLDLVGEANRAGKPLTLGDVGARPVQRLAGTSYRKGEEAGENVGRFLTERDIAAPERLNRDIAQYVSSGPSAAEATEALTSSRAAAATPLYEATDRLQGVWSPRLQRFFEDPDIKRGLAHGYALERRDALSENRIFDPTMMGVDLDMEGNIKLLRTPNMRVIDMAKRGLDKLIAEQRNEITGKLSTDGRSLEKLRQAYLSEVDGLDKAGVYRKARDAWSGPSKSLDAIRLGRTAFANTPEENAALFGRLNANDQEFARIGLADILRERLGKAADMPGEEARRLIGREGGWLRRQIRPFFKSDEDFNGFVKSVTRESDMFSFKREVMGGSQTAERQAAEGLPVHERAQRGMEVGESLRDLRLARAAVQAWRMWRDLGFRGGSEVDDAVAKILFSPNAAETDIARRLLGPQPERGGYLRPVARGVERAVPFVAGASGDVRGLERASPLFFGDRDERLPQPGRY